MQFRNYFELYSIQPLHKSFSLIVIKNTIIGYYKDEKKKKLGKFISNRMVRKTEIITKTINVFVFVVSRSDMGRRRKASKKAATAGQKNLENKTNIDPTPAKNIAKQRGVVEKSESTVPVGILSRLDYPLVKHTETNRSSISDEEEDTIEFDFRPRFVFMCNLCLVCMKLSRIICKHCKMVWYCTEEHKQYDRYKHRELCKVLSNTCSLKCGLALAKDLQADQYRELRMKLLETIEAGLNRRLDLWEKEIVLYPRVCSKCRNFDADNDLKCCPQCQVNFHCEGHADDHFQWCPEYQILRRILLMQHKHGNVNPVIPNVSFKSARLLPEDFDVFMLHLYDSSSLSSTYYREMDCYTYALLSHVASVPLTTLYALQKCQSDWKEWESCTIHVVGAEFQFEGTNLHVWETLFLHCLPNLRHLSLVLTGPELYVPDVPVNLLGRIRMCSKCKLSGRRISVSFVPNTLYHEFEGRSKGFCKPDLICFFNPGLYRVTGFNGRDTWPETIRTVCKHDVPVVVTAYTKHEIPLDLERIKSICDVEVTLEPRRNPFASLKPDRNFVSDDTVPLIYKNYFISIVKRVV